MMKYWPFIYLLSFSLFGIVLSQKTYPSRIKFTTEMLYEMKLDTEPTSVRLMLDPRNSFQIAPHFDLVFMASSPRIEIRRIPDVTMRVSTPKDMTFQQIVADFTTIPTSPNSVGVLPPETIDSQPPYVWWITTGKYGSGSNMNTNEGGIYLVDMSASTWEPQAIYKHPRSGFTHVEWVDMNIDGKVDCITIIGRSNRASLIWLAQPRSGSGYWIPNELSNSTFDVGGTDFKVMDVMLPKGRGIRKMIVVAGRLTARLHGIWVDDEDNDWTMTSKVRYTLIDQGDAYINVEVVDLNGDGNLDILTSAAAYGGRPGRVMAYEAPNNGLGAGVWRKRILHEWIPLATSVRMLIPGPAYPFFISSIYKQAEYKPHILVSGAHDGKVYILSPDSWSPYVWTYTMDEIFSGKHPIGVPAIFDVEGDGNPEIFVPAGESIHVMKYVPSKSTRLRSAAFSELSIIFLLFCFLIFDRFDVSVF